MIQDPVTLKERRAVATRCCNELKLPIPTIVDTVDDHANKAYKGWPDRLYLVGTDGRLAYAGGRGPFYFSPNEFQASVDALLKKAKTQ